MKKEVVIIIIIIDGILYVAEKLISIFRSSNNERS